MAAELEWMIPYSGLMNPMPPLVEPGDFFVPYPVEVQVGGATVFIMGVDRFEKL